MRAESVNTHPRFALSVRRYHTWPVIQQQTIADHTLHVMRIYTQIFGPMSPELSTHLIWHDAGEKKTGDLPWPIKAENPDIGSRLKEIERQAVSDMVDTDTRKFLDLRTPTADELRHFKIAEYIEMAEFGVVEMMLGNRLAEPIVTRMLECVQRAVTNIDRDYRPAVDVYCYNHIEHFIREIKNGT